MDDDFALPSRDACDALQRYATRYPEGSDALRPLQEQLLGDVDVFHRTNVRGHVTSSALVLDKALRHALAQFPNARTRCMARKTLPLLNA